MKKHLTFTDAAEKVLQEYGKRKPMHYRDIVKISLKKKMISTKGLTPEATLTAVIGMENRSRLSRGEEPRFVAHGNGMYSLMAWQEKGLIKQIQENNKQVKNRFYDHLMKMDPHAFEILIGRLLTEMGFENVEVTQRHGDGGIDVKGELVVGSVVGTKMAVQVKKWKNNIHTPIVTQLRGSLQPHEQGLIITTSNFSKGAIEEAKDPYKAPISLMDGEKLVDLLVEHNIGIRKTDASILEIDEGDEIINIMTEKTKKGLQLNKIKIFGRCRGKTYKGLLLNMRKVKIGNKVYNSPSKAANRICGYNINGWDFWKYEDPTTGDLEKIKNLRLLYNG